MLHRKSYENGPIEDAKQKCAKQLASNLVKFIQLVAGIAAQGASVVFGPANLYFNAVQFLLNTPAKIPKFYDDFTLLFEDINTYLKQFQIYQRIERFAKVDVELKKDTHKLLITFVDIRALSIKLMTGSKWIQIKTLGRVAIFDDSGVRAELEGFKRLIDHQSRISDAVTLEHVLKSEHDLEISMKKVFEMLNKASEDNITKLQEVWDDLKEDVRSLKAGQEVPI